MRLGQIPYPPLATIAAKDRLRLERFSELLFQEAMPAGFIGSAAESDVVLRHTFDAILPALAPESQALFPLWNNGTLEVFDLGSGVGLPALPLAILFSQHRFHLVDAQAKRLEFAQRAATLLGIHNVVFYHTAVQNFRRDFPHSPHASVVLFRAFRKILASLELALHVLPQPPTTPAAKILYWRSQPVPFSAEGQKRLEALGYGRIQFLRFSSAEHILPRGVYIFEHLQAPTRPFPRGWKKIAQDPLVKRES
ncbi:MAG: class I SAM-dependent methyltransferase [Turneriella sp.]|nr:class I SAM-dependent methyltransferase [Turneriella sp.]